MFSQVFVHSGVSIQRRGSGGGVSVQGDLCPGGLFLGVYLSGRPPYGVPVRETPPYGNVQAVSYWNAFFLYDVTFCLAAQSHVPSRGSLSLVPCSFWGSLFKGSMSRGFLSGRGVLSKGVSCHPT